MSGKTPHLLTLLLLWPGLLPAKPVPVSDSLENGIVIIERHPNRRINFGRELEGERPRSGHGLWNGYEMFWNDYSTLGDSVLYSKLRPGNYSVWVLDSTYRMFHKSFTLNKNETLYIDAQTGTVPVGKKGLAVIMDKATNAPLSGAQVFFECSAPRPPKKAKLEFLRSAAISDSLGRVEIPPCLNKGDIVFVRYRVSDYSQREARVKIAPAMEEADLWRIGAILLDETVKPTYSEQKKSPLFFSGLTYSLGFPLSDGRIRHTLSQPWYFGKFGFDYGFEFPDGNGFVNIKAWIPFIPFLRGNWTVPLGALGTGVGAYRGFDEKIGYQAQVWYNFLPVHINMKVRKGFDGPFHSTWGIGASIPFYIAGKNRN